MFKTAKQMGEGSILKKPYVTRPQSKNVTECDRHIRSYRQPTISTFGKLCRRHHGGPIVDRM